MCGNERLKRSSYNVVHQIVFFDCSPCQTNTEFDFWRTCDDHRAIILDFFRLSKLHKNTVWVHHFESLHFPVQQAFHSSKPNSDHWCTTLRPPRIFSTGSQSKLFNCTILPGSCSQSLV